MVNDKRPPDSESQGHSDVQLSELVVHGLFGKYTHKIPLPTSSPGDDSFPSVLILYGPNGIGKTTVLKMLNGLIRLDFDIFRRIPFDTCHLEFTTGDRLFVRRAEGALVVSFGKHEVLLSLKGRGALDPNKRQMVEAFRADFHQSIENISFEFFEAERAHRFKWESTEGGRLDERVTRELRLDERVTRELIEQGYRWPEGLSLAHKVRDFVREAQLNSQAFFGSGEPDVFSKMIEDLAQPEESPKSLVEIREAVERVHVQDRVSSRLGLRSDRWDYDRLTKIINRDQLDSHALTVLSTYVDFLTSRSQARELVAERLITFENVMSEFLLDKRVRVSGKRGFEIWSGDSLLNETQLSSGEFQLLYLMVAALTTRRTGTVLAIDEPEISMHISWQRKLVRNLIKCASRAAPQIVLATHSPEVATEFSGNMVELSPTLT